MYLHLCANRILCIHNLLSNFISNYTSCRLHNSRCSFAISSVRTTLLETRNRWYAGRVFGSKWRFALERNISCSSILNSRLFDSRLIKVCAFCSPESSHFFYPHRSRPSPLHLQQLKPHVSSAEPFLTSLHYWEIFAHATRFALWCISLTRWIRRREAEEDVSF